MADTATELKTCTKCCKSYPLEDFKYKKIFTKRCLGCRPRRLKCEHNIRKTECKICGGSAICIHKRIKYKCKECKGSFICEHNKQKSYCKACSNGNIFCIHGTQKIKCVPCKGSGICDHNKRKYECSLCDPRGYFIHINQTRLRTNLCRFIKNSQQKPRKRKVLENIGCTIEEYKIYIESLFLPGMSWENRKEWEIDHVKPLRPKIEITMEELTERLHYTNTKPLWKDDNRSKHNN